MEKSVILRLEFRIPVKGIRCQNKNMDGNLFITLLWIDFLNLILNFNNKQ